MKIHSGIVIAGEVFAPGDEEKFLAAALRHGCQFKRLDAMGVISIEEDDKCEGEVGHTRSVAKAFRMSPVQTPVTTETTTVKHVATTKTEGKKPKAPAPKKPRTVKAPKSE